MSRLFFKYYLDVTKYNVVFCILFLIITPSIVEFIVLFGTVGVVASFMAYRYFQNIEYYFYINRGLSKTHLQLKTFLINMVASSVLLIILWSTYYR
jgi:hypothetical protein